MKCHEKSTSKSLEDTLAFSQHCALANFGDLNLNMTYSISLNTNVISDIQPIFQLRHVRLQAG